jgi:hypothetical protein
MFKRPSSAAVASERLRRTLCRYAETPSEARTTLEDFFTILPERNRYDDIIDNADR